MQLIDTHCHLDLPAFDADREEVLKRAREAGVSEIIIPSVQSSAWDGLISYCNADPGLYYALGLHPVFVEQHEEIDLALLEEKLSSDNTLAVGEIGLDYYIRDLDRERQQSLFIAQLKLASSAGLPVILHVRKAHDQVLALLRQYPVVGGIIHAFNGSLQQADRYIDIGFKLGFGGMLTYERSLHLRRLARALPIDALVLETDAPDMTVAQHQGERNSPEYLPHCLLALAEVRCQAATDLATATTANAREVLRIV